MPLKILTSKLKISSKTGSRLFNRILIVERPNQKIRIALLSVLALNTSLPSFQIDLITLSILQAIQLHMNDNHNSGKEQYFLLGDKFLVFKLSCSCIPNN